MFPTPTTVDAILRSSLSDLWAFLPELAVGGTIVALLVLRLFDSLGRLHLGWVALLGLIGALALACGQWLGLPELDPRRADVRPVVRLDLFSGLLSFDQFALALRVVVLTAGVLSLAVCLFSGIPDDQDAADFGTLLVGGTLGMMLMVTAQHLLMIIIALEMASLPGYALAGFLKGKRQGSEAALKYVVYGAAAAGVTLYGISLLAGRFGSGHLPDIAPQLAAAADEPVVLLGLIFVLCGLGFKLAAVPFHFWCPDVFEGAAAEVAGFLSVASKAAALGLTTRLFFSLGDLPAALIGLLAVLAALTASFGNLAAFGQTNLKRLLAYSTIAHAGYMLMAVCTLRAAGSAALLFYLTIYTIMNLGAFACVAYLRNRTGTEDLSGLRGCVEHSPLVVVALAVCLFSLLGLPPLAGFAAKFQLFRVLFEAGQSPTGPLPGWVYFTLLGVGVVNTALSAVYYLRVLRVMVLEPADTAGPTRPLRSTRAGAALVGTLALLLVMLGIAWGPLSHAAGLSVLIPATRSVGVSG
jgi:NADH-quinone oxidoreductase subunit N